MIILAEQGWAVTVNTYGLLGLAALHTLGLWWTKRHRMENHNELVSVKNDVGSVRTEIVEVKRDVKNVKRSVDGPMGIALQNAANALAIAAKALPGNSDLILQAVAAQKEADAHHTNMRAAEEEARLDQKTKERIIAEWKASQNPPLP